MERARVVLTKDGAIVDAWAFDVDGPLDLSVVDELARLQLGARRLGCAVRLERACPDLVRLIDLVGLRVEMER